MIGVFDSGVGGLSVWRELDRLLPQADILYLADSAAFPYGPRTPEFIRERTEKITRELLSRGCGLVVVACNTATVAAIKHLRGTFPEVPFVGVVPPVKVAAASGGDSPIVVLMTVNTAAGRKYLDLLAEHANGRKVRGVSLDLLARVVEDGSFREPETQREVVRAVLERTGPLPAGSQVVLGCTHYSFLREILEVGLGAGVTVLDPAGAVAAQTLRLVRVHGLPEIESGRREFLCTGEGKGLREFVEKSLNYPEYPVEKLEL